MSLVLNDYELNYRMAEGDAPITCGVNCEEYPQHECCKQIMNPPPYNPEVIIDDGYPGFGETKTTLGTTIDKLFTTRNFLIAGVAYLVWKVFIKKHK